MKSKTRVCVISPEIVGPHKNGGIGTHAYYLSLFLSGEMGQEVTFIYTGGIGNQDEAYWRKWFREEKGIEFVWISPCSITASDDGGHPPGLLQVSMKVCEWLRERAFDVCHFQESLGNGFRSFQAKRLGLAFQNTLLTCTVHSSWDWINQAMQTLPQHGRGELEAKYMERYSITHCDALISPSRYMLEWVAENRIPVRASQHVLPYLFDPELPAVGSRPLNRHLIFFGRFEVRKGILVFLDALRLLSAELRGGVPPVRVTFLGRSGYTPDGDGVRSIDRARAEVAIAFDLHAITDKGHREAMEFIATNNDALIVCPSLVDNSPYAIIECLQMGLNVIAARSGGIPELFEGSERLFEPNAEALAAKLREGLAGRLPPLRRSYDSDHSRVLWRTFLEKSPASPDTGAGAARGDGKPPHVIVGSGECGGKLLRTLTGLTAQEGRDFSVTVIAMGEAAITPEVRRLCDGRQWKITSVTGNENMVIEPDGSGENLILLCGGGLPESSVIARLTGGMDFSGADALGCRAMIVRGDPEARMPFEPLGMCSEGGIHWNEFGDGCCAVRGEHLPATVGGIAAIFEPAGMWALLAGLAAGGKDVDVWPEVLLTLARDDAALAWSDLDYMGQMRVLNASATGLPQWVRYELVNAVVAERKIHTLERERLRAEEKKHRGLGTKIAREAGRFFRKLGMSFGGERRS